jgi:hypothetical protein
MILKTFYITVISFFILLVPTLIIEKWDEFKGEDSTFVWESVLQIVFYSIPLLGLGFLILLGINLLTSYMIRRSRKPKRPNFYLLVTLAISLLPIFAFVLFDYSDRGRYFEEKTLVTIFFEYTPFLIWVILAIFLNWQYVVKRMNFH